MFCGNCGKKLEDGVKFCGFCGSPVEESKIAVNRADNNPVVYRNSVNMPRVLNLKNLGFKICFCILTIFNFIFSKASMLAFKSDWFGNAREFTFASALQYAKQIARFDNELNISGLTWVVLLVNIGIVFLIAAACLSFVKLRVSYFLAGTGTICNFFATALFVIEMIRFGGYTGLFELKWHSFSLNLWLFVLINIAQLVIANIAFSNPKNDLSSVYYNKDYTLHDKEAGHDWKCPDCGRVNRGCVQMCSCGWVHKKGRV